MLVISRVMAWSTQYSRYLVPALKPLKFYRLYGKSNVHVNFIGHYSLLPETRWSTQSYASDPRRGPTQRFRPRHRKKYLLRHSAGPGGEHYFIKLISYLRGTKRRRPAIWFRNLARCDTIRFPLSFICVRNAINRRRPARATTPVNGLFSPSTPDSSTRRDNIIYLRYDGNGFNGRAAGPLSRLVPSSIRLHCCTSLSATQV